MAKITYIEHDGTSHVVEVRPGLSVMEGAIMNGIPGILAECGGSCACGTCHVYVDPDWQEKVGPPSELEGSILEFANEVAPSSRLACQIRVTDVLNGLIVRMPERQR